MNLLVATNNHHKRRELGSIFAGHTLLVPADVGITFGFEETGATFLENALGKAYGLYRMIAGQRPDRLGEPWAVVADDSGICVSALGGRPGIYSARYGSPDGGRTELVSQERNRFLLEEVGDALDRSAYFACCMVALLGEDRFFVVQERWDGEIAISPSSGTGGFGYDPIFYLPDRNLTVADLPEEEKNRISHRGKAAARLARLLESE